MTVNRWEIFTKKMLQCKVKFQQIRNFYKENVAMQGQIPVVVGVLSVAFIEGFVQGCSRQRYIISAGSLCQKTWQHLICTKFFEKLTDCNKRFFIIREGGIVYERIYFDNKTGFFFRISVPYWASKLKLLLCQVMTVMGSYNH